MPSSVPYHKFARRALVRLGLFLAVLLLLRLGILGLNRGFPELDARARLVAREGIDTSALFYTESRQALAAEKAVRRALAARPIAAQED